MDAVGAPLTDEQLRAIYSWIDAIPLSRPKRNISRDFSDGVMLAEANDVVAAYFPQLVELHNYPAANSLKQKIYNHETLNSRVLKKLGFTIPRIVIEDIVNCKPGVIETVLNTLQIKMAQYRAKKNSSDQPTQQNTPPSNNNIISDFGHPQQKESVYKTNFNAETLDREANLASKGSSAKASHSNAVNEEILLEKEQQIRELQETVEILELKIAKLEQLVRLKDNKIQKLLNNK